MACSVRDDRLQMFRCSQSPIRWPRKRPSSSRLARTTHYYVCMTMEFYVWWVICIGISLEVRGDAFICARMHWKMVRIQIIIGERRDSVCCRSSNDRRCVLEFKLVCFIIIIIINSFRKIIAIIGEIFFPETQLLIVSVARSGDNEQKKSINVISFLSLQQRPKRIIFVTFFVR